MLRHRLLMGGVLIASLLGLLALDQVLDAILAPGWLAWSASDDGTFPPGVILFAVAVAVCPVAGWELGNLFRRAGMAASRRTCTVAAIAGLLVATLVPTTTHAVEAALLMGTVGLGVFVGALAVYSQHRRIAGAMGAAGSALIAFIYLGVAFSFIIALRREYAAWVILAVLLTTKSCDIGAYFTGRAIGRHRLIPWLSPGKTWEGLAGGVAASALVGLGFSLLLPGDAEAARSSGLPMITPLQGALIGGLFGVLGQFGDLVASLAKRDAGLKDSSAILPGFGGVLDVIDSVLLVAPAAFWLLTQLDSAR